MEWGCGYRKHAAERLTLLREQALSEIEAFLNVTQVATKLEPYQTSCASEGLAHGAAGRLPRGGPSQGRYIQATGNPMATTTVPAASEVESESRTNDAFPQLTPEQLARTGRHARFGSLTLRTWLEFFLAHEGHHLYVILKRAHGIE